MHSSLPRHSATKMLSARNIPVFVLVQKERIASWCACVLRSCCDSGRSKGFRPGSYVLGSMVVYVSRIEDADPD